MKVIELAGIGAAPFCGMMLAELGADVVRIERKSPSKAGLKMDPRYDFLARGKRTVVLDLKSRDGLQVAHEMIKVASIFVEGALPGTTERLGIGPAECLKLNPRLVYGRMTGWGQEGPLSMSPGHDLNFIALSGALSAIGPRDGAPTPPLNLVGNLGGGALYLLVGILAALIEQKRSGLGQVIDAAMVDGAAHLMTFVYSLLHSGEWRDERGTNSIDGGAPFYSTYETSDGKFVSIACIEPKFYRQLVNSVGVSKLEWLRQNDPDDWPEIREELTAAFKTRTQSEWCTMFEGMEVCFAPVLGLHDAPHHPHLVARKTFVEDDGVVRPAPAPRFSRTPTAPRDIQSTREKDKTVLGEWGIADALVSAITA
ncbi:CaiB/BaiF CoA-transferase family protein [Ensifer sp. ENS04]|uniref:CaiB/BaiF CoA transferase family protein n=1 Tax=Ensifer sp. ENS04 TaxID=2769281 RepID=UPI001FEEC280|nr:CaiB/BaiF CoA-transferase family protein [Ensifer sp. ENS04]